MTPRFPPEVPAMRYSFTAALLLGLSPAVTGHTAPPNETRYGIALDLKSYPQATAKEALASVIKAVEDKHLDYLVAPACRSGLHRRPRATTVRRQGRAASRGDTPENGRRYSQTFPAVSQRRRMGRPTRRRNAFASRTSKITHLFPPRRRPLVPGKSESIR